MATELRAQIEQEFKELISLNGSIYIYGAGIVGKRLYKVMKTRNSEELIKGFIVSQKNNDEPVCDKKVYELGEVINKDVKILVAAGDAYQNEILANLKKNGYNNAVNAYIYTFLDEKHIPNGLNREVPQEVIIDTDELMLMQFKESDFFRYDILLKLNRLKKESVEKKVGLEPTVEVGTNLEILGDGTELAFALYSDVKQINIKQKHDYDLKEYDSQWLESVCLIPEQEEVKALLAELKEEWKKPFIGIIWPPAYDIVDDIVEEMKKTVDVTGIGEFELESKEELGEFIRSIYNTDDTVASQIEDKVERMQQENTYKIKLVEFYMNNPEFYIKRYGHTISRKGRELKTKIREQFRNQVNGYIFDIILHTADNYFQSEEVRNVVKRYL